MSKAERRLLEIAVREGRAALIQKQDKLQLLLEARARANAKGDPHAGVTYDMAIHAAENDVRREEERQKDREADLAESRSKGTSLKTLWIAGLTLLVTAAAALAAIGQEK